MNFELVLKEFELEHLRGMNVAPYWNMVREPELAESGKERRRMHEQANGARQIRHSIFTAFAAKREF